MVSEYVVIVGDPVVVMVAPPPVGLPPAFATMRVLRPAMFD
jgi:hypothetical protein